MVVKPKVRGFICTTAHPKGCMAYVKKQIDYIKSKQKFNCKKKVLIIGCSTGYGLASRITCAFGGDASTIGVMFEHPSSGKRTATAGWYNTEAFEKFAQKQGLYAKTINGDAFSSDVKQQTIDIIKSDLGKVNMVVYSLAAPRRTMSDGTTVSSVLKTIGKEYTNKTIDLKDNIVSDITISSATQQEIEDTIKVMGGEDWKDWISALKNADAIDDDAITVAYSYIGPELTFPIYAEGTIGMAKKHLLKTSDEINKEFDGIKAYISVNKALVTQSSAAIPIVPLYITILYKIMKEKNLHEGCIEQMYRLFGENLALKPNLDEKGRIRLDDYELRSDVQEKVKLAWDKIKSDN
ncbi:MAG: trans-2-enoyl-CoA reductase family protein, partial [Oscillospiraceae bacterium]|nr:trans-2-enoyl-CoA reductase family protein [Oscillospiraceae bacterium]